MIKEFIGTGKTIEEASLSAKAGLNAPATADVKIEVIQMPKKKVLGLFGGADAKVKAWYEDGKKEFDEQISDAEQKIADAKQELADLKRKGSLSRRKRLRLLPRKSRRMRLRLKKSLKRRLIHLLP